MLEALTKTVNPNKAPKIIAIVFIFPPFSRRLSPGFILLILFLHKEGIFEMTGVNNCY